jgi:uncharacterized protein (DUF1501 family)
MHSMTRSRRAFLRQLGQYASLGAASRLALPLSLLGSATAEAATDYKALVCVYLYGGNDYANTVVPYDNASYASYSSLRSSIALSQANLAATALSPRNSLAGGLQFALAPELAPLKTLFDAGQLSLMLNIGTLIAPLTKAQYASRGVPVPAHLFSHIDQQKYSQTLIGDQGSGWAGRIEDLLMSGNTNAAFSAISASGNAIFLTGQNVDQYQVSARGATAISGANGGRIYGSAAVGTALQSLITGSSSNPLEDVIGTMARRSIGAQQLMTSALGTTSPFASLFPANNGLASQLQVVARIINAHALLGTTRQVFLVSMGGFDNHDHLSTAHPQLMTTLANAMSAFHAALTQAGLGSSVVTFTASDFGRTLTSNGDGTDHGWGSHHLLMGDAIQGGKILGTPPALANNGPDDVGQGRLIPTTSWEQLAGALGAWMGASPGALAAVLPNLPNFGTGGPVFV